MENEFEVKDYGSFSTAITTVDNLTSQINENIELITTCGNTLCSDTVFMGPISDSCKEGFAKAISKLSTINTNNDKITSTIGTVSDNYQTGDQQASNTVTSATSNLSNLSTEALSGNDYSSVLSSMPTPSKEEIIEKATSMGYSSDYIKTVIGTAQNEGYVNDPFLYYGWSSVMLNNPVSDDVIYGWGGGNDYYSKANILNGYEIATDDVLKSVYLSLTNRNTNIAECDGMYSSTPAGYSVLYDSPVYNCTVYERS